VNTVKKFLEQTGLLTTLDRIRFSGVVGKITLATITFFIFLSVAVWKLTTEWMIFSASFLGFLGIIFVVHKVMDFANSHPAEAMLEGAELVQYRQVELAAKNIGVLPSGPAVPSPSQPLALPLDAGTEETEA